MDHTNTIGCGCCWLFWAQLSSAQLTICKCLLSDICSVRLMKTWITRIFRDFPTSEPDEQIKLDPKVVRFVWIADTAVLCKCLSSPWVYHNDDNTSPDPKLSPNSSYRCRRHCLQVIELFSIGGQTTHNKGSWPPVVVSFAFAFVVVVSIKFIMWIQLFDNAVVGCRPEI